MNESDATAESFSEKIGMAAMVIMFVAFVAVLMLCVVFGVADGLNGEWPHAAKVAFYALAAVIFPAEVVIAIAVYWPSPSRKEPS